MDLEDFIVPDDANDSQYYSKSVYRKVSRMKDKIMYEDEGTEEFLGSMFF